MVYIQAGISLKIHKLGLGKYLFPTIAEGQKTFVNYSREQAKERIALGVGVRKDLFHYLLDARDPQTGEGYSMSELWSESNLLIAAGEVTLSKLTPLAFCSGRGFGAAVLIHIRVSHTFNRSCGSVFLFGQLSQGSRGAHYLSPYHIL